MIEQSVQCPIRIRGKNLFPSKSGNISFADQSMPPRNRAAVEEEEKIYLTKRLTAFYESDDTCLLNHGLSFSKDGLA